MPSYTEDDVKLAVLNLANGDAMATAATRHGVPRTTLRDRQSGAQPIQLAHEDQQRLSATQEDQLERWIITQEALGYAPTHAQVRAIVTGILRTNGDYQPLGRKWLPHFIRRHPSVKNKLGRRIDWQRINAVTLESIKLFFRLYETISWIPAHRRYNADEGGIIPCGPIYPGLGTFLFRFRFGEFSANEEAEFLPWLGIPPQN